MTSALDRLANLNQPTKWLFYGDSITQGAVHTFGYRDYTELFAERVRFELGRRLDIVINSAISGHTTCDLVSGFAWRVEQFRPDIIFLMIGMNDASPDRRISVSDFKDNLVAIHKSVSALGGTLVLQTTCTIQSEHSNGRFEYLPRYMEVVRVVAEENRLMLIDHYRHWESLGRDTLPYLLSDAFHPNEMGHRVMAQQVFRSLNIFDSTSYCCKLFTP